MSYSPCGQRSCSSGAAAKLPKRRRLMPYQMIPGLEQRQSRPTDFADGAARLSPALQRVRDEPGSSVFLLLLLFLLQPAFLLRGTLGCFLMFPFSFVFFSLITHIRFSVLENHLHQNAAQNPSSENQVQGIVAAQVGQRSSPAVGNGTLLARGQDPRRACFFAVRRLTIRPAVHKALARAARLALRHQLVPYRLGMRGRAWRQEWRGNRHSAGIAPRRRRDESVAFRARSTWAIPHRSGTRQQLVAADGLGVHRGGPEGARASRGARASPTNWVRNFNGSFLRYRNAAVGPFVGRN
jgi:hypothetical protein